jgi:hypothetical protein
MTFSPRGADNAVRVGGNVKPPVKIRDVRPVYPADARAARVKGVVIIEARIGVDGGIEEAYILKSIPELESGSARRRETVEVRADTAERAADTVIMAVTITFDID